MIRIFQRCFSGHHGIALIATGTLLLFFTVVPFRLIVIMFALSLLATGICVMHQKGK